MNSNDRTEANLPPVLYNALLSGTCKSIITERHLYHLSFVFIYSHSMALEDTEIRFSDDFKNGNITVIYSYVDHRFHDYLQLLSCFHNLSSYQIDQLIELFNPIPFSRHEYVR